MRNIIRTTHANRVSRAWEISKDFLEQHGISHIPTTITRKQLAAFRKERNQRIKAMAQRDVLGSVQHELNAVHIVVVLLRAGGARSISSREKVYDEQY